MTNDKITPALTAEEWQARSVVLPHLIGGESVAIHDGHLSLQQWHTVNGMTTKATILSIQEKLLPAFIAFANETLPDNSPHKITRERINRLRDMAENENAWLAKHSNVDADAALREATAIINALESLLPPA